MRKTVFAIMACTLVVVFAGCGENTDRAVSLDGNRFEQIVETIKPGERDASEIREHSSKVSEPDTDTDADIDEDVEADIDEDADTDDSSTVNTIRVIWKNAYSWAMGSDYVYVDSDGNIYEEREMEEPMFRPSGACKETYTGKQFTEDELNEFLSIDIYDEDRQKEVLSKKGIKFGK